MLYTVVQFSETKALNISSRFLKKTFDPFINGHFQLMAFFPFFDKIVQSCLEVGHAW